MTTVGADGWSSGAAYEGYIGRWSRLVAPLFLDWLDVPHGADWLDMGCGTAILTRAILDRCAEGRLVHDGDDRCGVARDRVPALAAVERDEAERRNGVRLAERTPEHLDRVRAAERDTSA